MIERRYMMSDVNEEAHIFRGSGYFWDLLDMLIILRIVDLDLFNAMPSDEAYNLSQRYTRRI